MASVNKIILGRYSQGKERIHHLGNYAVRRLNEDIAWASLRYLPYLPIVVTYLPMSGVVSSSKWGIGGAQKGRKYSRYQRNPEDRY